MAGRKKKVIAPIWASSPDELIKREEKENKVGKKRVASIKSEYDGHKFDSQLEVYCYKALRNAGLDFTYAAKTYVISEAFKCIGESYEPDKRKGSGMYPKSKALQSIKYTPDFIGSNFIVETKGRQNESFPMRWKLFKKYMFENNMKHDLYMPKNHKQVDECIQMILNKINN